MIYAMRYCPQCRGDSLEFDGRNRHQCRFCGFTLYRNVAAAVAVILRCQGKLVLTVRGKDPGRGMLGLPGGFIDNNETAEEALRREVREEIGAELGPVKYFCNQTNVYDYRGVSYHTLDLYFLADLPEPPAPADRTEIAEVRLIAPEELKLSDLAFTSAWYALRQYLDHCGAGS